MDSKAASAPACSARRLREAGLILASRIAFAALDYATRVSPSRTGTSELAGKRSGLVALGCRSVGCRGLFEDGSAAPVHIGQVVKPACASALVDRL